jgi:hypothetical protein
MGLEAFKSNQIYLFYLMAERERETKGIVSLFALYNTVGLMEKNVVDDDVCMNDALSGK